MMLFYAIALLQKDLNFYTYALIPIHIFHCLIRRPLKHLIIPINMLKKGSVTDIKILTQWCGNEIRN